jgi:hypothetical protein
MTAAALTIESMCTDDAVGLALEARVAGTIAVAR